MATFALSEVSLRLRRVDPAQVVGSVLGQGSMSPSHTHTIITHSFTQDTHVCSLLGGSWGWWWVQE